MKKNYPLLICILSLIFLNIFLYLANVKNKNNHDTYFRLHVVANSNLINDQIIKLNVAEKIEKYIASIPKASSAETNKKEYAKEKIIDNISNILNIANNELKFQNADYSCYAKIGKITYDVKSSDKLVMDAGIYDSLQIVLGEGKGENFWSLIFPYSYNDSFDLSDSQENIISSNIEVKSGILEILKNVVKTFKS